MDGVGRRTGDVGVVVVVDESFVVAPVLVDIVAPLLGDDDAG